MITLLSHIRASLVATAVFVVLLCVLYPLVVWGVAQVAFPHQANGSLLTKDGKVVGSELIGQPFSAPSYFHPRPSAAGSGYDATSSSGSNLGPTSAKLFNGTTVQSAPADPQPATATAPVTQPAVDPPTAPAAPAPVVGFDGIALRVLHYCDDNNLAFTLLREGKPIEPASFKTADGWDEVKLITPSMTPNP